MLWVKLRYGVIERDGEAIVVALMPDFHVTRMRPRGRPKATAKHAAVVLAFHYETLRLGKRLKAREAVARHFGYREERTVRRIVGRRNPLGAGKWVITMGVNGRGALAIVTDHPESVVETDTSIRIDGRGWVWMPGLSLAIYGQLRGGGQKSREFWPLTGAEKLR